MQPTFSIPQLLAQAFGLTKVSYVVPQDAPQAADVNYAGVQVKPMQEVKKLSWMGTPIMFPTLFKGGSYQYYKENGVLDNKPLADFDIPPASIIDFRRAKNITKTRISGTNGTVKEIYGFDDWQIRIRGLCLDTPQMSAYDQHLELLKWESLADSIQVIGELFKDKSIYRLVIEEIDFPQREGSTNIIPFVITAVSDEPIELNNLV